MQAARGIGRHTRREHAGIVRRVRLPRIGQSKLVSTWILITLVASLVAWFDNGFLVEWTALAPERIWHGQVWRIVTWPLIERTPISLILTCAAIYKFGGELAPRWGDRRLRRFMLEIVIAGGVVSALGALVSPTAWSMFHNGGWAVSDALVIAWARQYPNDSIRIYGFLELRGQQLVWFTVGVTTLIAIATSPFVYAPELVAAWGAAFYPRGLLER